MKWPQQMPLSIPLYKCAAIATHVKIYATQILVYLQVILFVCEHQRAIRLRVATRPSVATRLCQMCLVRTMHWRLLAAIFLVAASQQDLLLLWMLGMLAELTLFHLSWKCCRPSPLHTDLLQAKEAPDEAPFRRVAHQQGYVQLFPTTYRVPNTCDIVLLRHQGQAEGCLQGPRLQQHCSMGAAHQQPPVLGGCARQG